MFRTSPKHPQIDLFRKRIYKYDSEHATDLLGESVRAHRLERGHAKPMGPTRSLAKEKQTSKEHVEMVLSGIQGAPSRFELTETEQGVTVHDTTTGNTHQAEPVRRRKKITEQRWKIWLDDEQQYRYFGPSSIRASARRQANSTRSTSELNKRNNVEVSIWHLTQPLSGDKTSYRGLIKHKL